MDCGLVFQNPMPDEDELKTFYEHDFRSEFVGPPMWWLVRRHELTATWRMSLLGRAPEPPQNARVLEVGCAMGVFLEKMRQRGCKCMGIEPGARHAEIARRQRGLDVRCQMLEEAELPRKSFDVICLFHVLEHMRSPRKLLEKLRSSARDDCLLWVEVPNLERPAKWNYKAMITYPHMFNFTKRTLAGTASLAGWDVLDTFAAGLEGEAPKNLVLFARPASADCLRAPADLRRPPEVAELLKKLRSWRRWRYVLRHGAYHDLFAAFRWTLKTLVGEEGYQRCRRFYHDCRRRMSGGRREPSERGS